MNLYVWRAEIKEQGQWEVRGFKGEESNRTHESRKGANPFGKGISRKKAGGREGNGGKEIT